MIHAVSYPSFIGIPHCSMRDMPVWLRGPVMVRPLNPTLGGSIRGTGQGSSEIKATRSNGFVWKFSVFLTAPVSCMGQSILDRTA